MFTLEKKYLVTPIFVILLLCITFYNISKIKVIKKSELRKNIAFGNDISCHVKTEGDALPSAEDASFSPPADSIFFHETSCRGGLTSRQACAVESAAKAHPDRTIYVLFSGPISSLTLNSTSNAFFALKNYPNIDYARVHALEYSKETALHQLFLDGDLSRSYYKVSHSSDLLRVITMFKFGGIYLDTDVIVLKSLNALGKNWVARQSPKVVNMAVMNVGRDEIGRELMRKVMKEIDETYQPTFWTYNGPEALARVLFEYCNVTEPVNFSNVTCHGFHVYAPDLVYPVPYENHMVLFEQGILFEEHAYTVHLWSSLSQYLDVQLDSPMERMALRHCPATYELYEDSFGFI